MKKNYKAPAFDIITYSLHEAVAGSCSGLTYEQLKINFAGFNYSFIEGDKNCTDEPILTGYCYFGVNGGTAVATS